MFVSRKEFEDLKQTVKELRRDLDMDYRANKLVANNLSKSIKANTKFIRSVSSRVSAIKPGLRKTFNYLSNSDEANRASNTQLAKWLEENI